VATRLPRHQSGSRRPGHSFEAYAEGTLGTLTPAAGHAAVNRIAQWRGWAGPNDGDAPPPVTGSYQQLRGTLPLGWQANHLNQTAAYGNLIPRSEGLTVGMAGDVLTKPGSPHWAFHRSLEKEFWDDYRENGRFYGQTPTNAQYGAASERALRAGGFSPAQASHLAAQAAAERAAYGLDEAAPIPGNIPRTIWKW
jgi:hypothetical protein